MTPRRWPPRRSAVCRSSSGLPYCSLGGCCHSWATRSDCHAVLLQLLTQSTSSWREGQLTSHLALDSGSVSERKQLGGGEIKHHDCPLRHLPSDDLVLD